VLKIAERQGNTVSPRLRDAWDGIDLQTLTRRNNALRASNPQISIISHITIDELRRSLNETEKGNGFGNRFLWFAVRRSKELPDGGQLPESELKDLAELYSKAVQFARTCGRMTRDTAAGALWRDVYGKLTAEKSGMVDAMTARAEAHVLRLSMIYSLLDTSATIGKAHLEAALEVWRYAEDSVRYIFAGQELGDPIADTILEALRSSTGGLSRTDIYSSLFQRHKSSNEINAALDVLRRMGLAYPQSEKTSGRDVECWFPTHTAQKAQKGSVQ